ncbi:MAG TPA: hypothetical protein VGW74_04685 [Propionibacteriaceae bacterium]|nr:hypothetical protein [Propionibacteriaceae bacterium]
MTEKDWKAALDKAREQRGVDRNPVRRAWDERFCRWWRTYVDRSCTPNKAVTFAYRMTTDQIGKRPGPYPDGSDAQEQP